MLPRAPKELIFDRHNDAAPASSARALGTKASQVSTLLLSRGVRPKLVRHLLGHASIQLTLDRYSHWIPSMGRATASAMDDALEGDRARDEVSG